MPPTHEELAEQCACPRLDPDDWDEVESDWSDIAFLRSHARSLMGVPFGFGSARDGLHAKAEALGAKVAADAMVLLGPGRFWRPLLLEVEDGASDAPGLYRPGGIAFSRLVPAPMGEMKRVMRRTREIAKERYGRSPDALYVWYLTCRYCSSPRNYETLFVAHYRSQ